MPDSSIAYLSGVITGKIGSGVSFELRDLRRCSLLAKASEALQKSQTKLEWVSLLFALFKNGDCVFISLLKKTVYMNSIFLSAPIVKKSTLWVVFVGLLVKCQLVIYLI
ncbi:hypothetical protein B1199_17660 [Pseudoalteromonas ulvae]|uniref:Uncharacterized protein n=1 Tax=Pseudoalteromonas ulvae TaxID=107327 RepID=A0A244CMQ4_PSEDV|nr:hypothetical protein B1199_17660 [Pseudoalteromonas ulvae]